MSGEYIYNGRYGYVQRSDEALRVGNRRRTRPGGEKMEEIVECLSKTNKNKLRNGRENFLKFPGAGKGGARGGPTFFRFYNFFAFCLQSTTKI